MKRHLLVFITVLMILSLAPFQAPVQARGAIQAGAPGQDEPFLGEPLCLPGAYLENPVGCLPLGPSAYLTSLARIGITLPLRALPGIKPDPALSAMNEQYLSVRSNGSVPVYVSMDAAAAHSAGRTIGGGRGLKYLSVLGPAVSNDQGIFYQLRSGEWINAGDADVACCVRYGRFQGFLFHQTPRTSFGWVLSPIKTKTSPGYNSPDTGRELNREEVVQIYAMEKKDQANWLLIGLDEWVDDQYVGRVTPDPSHPPQGVENNRWIEVNLGEQTLMVYEGGQLVFATLIATGVKPFYTRPGLFTIYKKKPLETMSGAFEGDKSDYYYLEDVPWTMYFDDARALHGAYWRTMYGYPASHGCVNLSPGDSNWLFSWAKEGDWVYVWDPTGETPTDPEYYGSGGA